MTSKPKKYFKQPHYEAPARQDGTVEFLNINELKKKSVRGLLRKRAKKYSMRFWLMIKLRTGMRLRLRCRIKTSGEECSRTLLLLHSNRSLIDE